MIPRHFLCIALLGFATSVSLAQSSPTPAPAPVSLRSPDNIPFNTPLDPSNHLEAADTKQVSASVEVYELPKTEAFALQKAFADAPDAGRVDILTKLRNGLSPADVKTIAFGQRACETGQISLVSSIKEYRYPTEFDNAGGQAFASAFETRNLGCTMELNISPPDKDGTYSTGIKVSTVDLAATDRYHASNTDIVGTITQPIFTSEKINTQVRLTFGIPKLLATYSPARDGAAGNVLRLVFVTVQPDR